jgi:hypothetical protein
MNDDKNEAELRRRIKELQDEFVEIAHCQRMAGRLMFAAAVVAIAAVLVFIAKWR